MTLDGEITAVTLVPAWRKAVKPWELQTHVTAAVNAAIMSALAEHVESAQSAEPDEVVANQELPEGAGLRDPLSEIDNILNLIDEASAELEQFETQLAEVTSTAAVVRSGGGMSPQPVGMVG